MAMKKSPRTRPATRSRSGKRRSARPVDPSAQRLNKILAAAGLGSRREVEELIVQGRVEIDREIVTDLSCKVDPSQVTIKVDGSVLKKQRPIYYALNKPTGVLSTNRDPAGRMRVIDLVPDTERVFSVGRLDRSSEGLILLTNDGELAQRLAHPKFSVQKSYFVVVAGVMTNEELAKLRKGVHLAEGFARIDGATIRRQRKGCTELEIVLSEGKNREIRRILARAGHKVVVLRRIAIGPLRLGQLPVGAARLLTSSEVKALYAATERKPVQRKQPAQTASPGAKAKPQSAMSAAPLFAEPDYDMDSEPMELDESALEMFGSELDDDDFVGHFSGATRGSVLAYDEAGASEAAPRPASKKPRSATGGRAAGGRPKRKSAQAGGRPQSSHSDGESRPAGRRGGGVKHRKPNSSGTPPATSKRSVKGSAKRSAPAGKPRGKAPRPSRGKGKPGR